MSAIEWTDETWNPVVGCTPVSSGCLNCYAAGMAVRLEAMGKKEYAARQDAAHTCELLLQSDGSGKPIWERMGDASRDARSVRIAEVKNGRAVFTGEVRTLEERLLVPLKWKKPRMVFVNSMSDLFHEAVPFEFIDRVFAVMALCPHHTFQVLTKRPERMAEYLTSKLHRPLDARIWSGLGSLRHMIERDVRGTVDATHFTTDGTMCPLPNVWLGTSVEDQRAADERIPHLLNCPAVVRFLSCEPLLGAVDLRAKCPPHYAAHLRADRISWVIVGGESGPKARGCGAHWIHNVMSQCSDAGVPCFVKQLGSKPFTDPTIPGKLYWPTIGDDFDTHVIRDRKGGDPSEWPEELRVREFPGSSPPQASPSPEAIS